MNSGTQTTQLSFFEREALAHLDVLLRAAKRITPAALDAEDIVQETYLRAWKHFDSFAAGTNCRAWLFRIMFNVIKVRGGAQTRRAESALDDVPEWESQSSNVVRFDPGKKVEEREVLETIQQLAPEHRAVLWLVVVEEFAYREVAEMLDTPIGTVMSRLHRARRELRKLLVTHQPGHAVRSQ